MADLTRTGDAENIVKEITEHYGHLDKVVNTVGLCEVRTSPVEPDDLWERAFQSVLMTSVRIRAPQSPSCCKAGAVRS